MRHYNHRPHSYGVRIETVSLFPQRLLACSLVRINMSGRDITSMLTREGAEVLSLKDKTMDNSSVGQ